MGVFKDANVTEIRVYEDPSDTIKSDYRVALPITVLDAVIDPNTGKSLTEIINMGNSGDIDCGMF